MAEKHRLHNVLFSLINCMIRTLNKRLFKTSKDKRYIYCFPHDETYVRSFDREERKYIDININDVYLDEDSTRVFNTLNKLIPYAVFTRFAKKYNIHKDKHDYPVDDKYATLENYNELVDFIYQTGYFEKKLFKIMTKIYKKSNLLFLDNGKKEDFEKLFY